LSKRSLVLVGLAAVVAAVCVRLGFWQLDRLQQQRAINAKISEGLASTPTPARALLATPGEHGYRRVTAKGTLDYDREIIFALRMREGSPGVNLITPLRLAGTDTVVLVNRGWVYSPDGVSVELPRWRESSEMTFEGFLQPFTTAEYGRVTASARSGAVRRLDRDSLAANLPYPIAAYSLTALSPSIRSDTTPVRLMQPTLDEGPHLGYAMQWFAFALIAVVGTGAVIRRQR
jgi:surfeit locus 1 family protein